MPKMKWYRLSILFVMIAGTAVASGCGLETGGIPDPCWATGLCSNTNTPKNGWANCPPGWQAVFKAGDTPNGYSGFASYDASLPGGDAILGPDGQPEVVVPSASDPNSLQPDAYCIGPGYCPDFAYIPAKGDCQAPAVSYLQGSFDPCPDHNQSNDCVCVVPGCVNHAPTPTNVPTPTPIAFLPDYTLTGYYCAQAPNLGGVAINTTGQYTFTIQNNPNVTMNSNPPQYFFVGPAGSKFTVEQCTIPNGNQNPVPPPLCNVSQLKLGTCAGVKGGGSGGLTPGPSCSPPAGGCPAGSKWYGGNACACLTIK